MVILSLKVVLRAGLEPTTLCLEGRCSIQLSYRSTYYATGFFEGYATPIPSHRSMSYTLGLITHPVRARTPCFSPCLKPVVHPIRAEKRVFFLNRGGKSSKKLFVIIYHRRMKNQLECRRKS